MKYFIKTAAGPVIYEGASMVQGGAYLSSKNIKALDKIKKPFPQMSDQVEIMSDWKYSKDSPSVRKKGLIVIGNTTPTLPHTQKSNVRTHEMTHYMRDKKNKWSARKYGKNPVATFVEEFAAHKRGGENVLRSIQGGLWTVASKADNPKLRKRAVDLILKFK